MPSVKSLRHGRLIIRDGTPGPTPPALEFVTRFVGTYGFGHDFPTEVERDRDVIVDLTAGPDEPIAWNLEASFVDRDIIKVLRDGVFPSIAETVTGLTPSSNNPNVPTLYDYEQNSLQFASGETGIKLAIDVVPTSDDEFSEPAGSKTIPANVIKVPKAGTSAPFGGFSVFQPAADTDRDIVYNAVGLSTGDDPDCAGSRKLFTLELQIFDTCDGPDPTDLTAGTIVERFRIRDAFLTNWAFAEGTPDTVTFSGGSLADVVDLLEG